MNARVFCRSLSLLLGFFFLQTKANGTEENLALRRNATQSSTYGLWFAERAVDGKPAVGVKSWSVCSSTKEETSPWWRLDLLYNYQVNRVVINNILECCAQRINGAEIRIGNSLENNGNDNPICAVVSSIPAGVSSTYVCNMTGQYVNVIIPGRLKMLTLCEVEVYGEGPVLTQMFVKLKLKSSLSLSEAAERVQILTQVESVLAERGISDVTLHWSQPPKQEVMREEVVPAQRKR